MWMHTDGNCAECCRVRFSAAGLLTCFADAPEAVLSVVTRFFCGVAQAPDAELALVALQSLAWCQRGEGGGAAQERERGEGGGGENNGIIVNRTVSIGTAGRHPHDISAYFERIWGKLSMGGGGLKAAHVVFR